MAHPVWRSVPILVVGLLPIFGCGGQASEAVLEQRTPDAGSSATSGAAEAARLVQAHVDRGLSATDREYFQSLSELRAQPDAANVIRETYRKTPQDQHVRRWLLADSLGGLDGPEAVASLAEIAAAPVPTPDGSAKSERVYAEEIQIRLRALEGLGWFARRGQPDALATLRECMASPVFTVRRMAAVAYAGSPRDPQRVREARAILPPADHWVTDDLPPLPHLAGPPAKKVGRNAPSTTTQSPSPGAPKAAGTP
jgi:HEAT repeat protein